MSLGYRKSQIRTSILFAFFATFISIDSAFAQEAYQFYRGVRSLGMGGTYVTTVNDETALLSNPAGLGKLRDTTFTLIDPEIHGGFESTGIATLDKIGKVTDINDLYDTLQNGHRGKHYHAKAQLFPSIVGPNFGFGVLAKYSYDAEVNAAGTNYRLDYTNDYAAVLGFNFSFFGGILKIGAAGRYMTRVELHQDLTAPPTGTYILKDLASEGSGLAADAGMIITAPIALLPSIGVVLRDIGTTSYNLRNGMIMSTATRPQDTKQSLDVSLGLYPIVSNRTRFTFTADYTSVLTASEETDAMRRIHAGMELNFADFFFLRGGMNQRYWTAGFEFATERFQIQGASYGEEIGVRPLQREDRRFVGKLSFRF